METALANALAQHVDEARGAVCGVCMTEVYRMDTIWRGDCKSRKAKRYRRRRMTAKEGRSVKRFALLVGCDCRLVLCIDCGRQIRSSNSPTRHLCPQCRKSCPFLFASPVPAYGDERRYVVSLLATIRCYQRCRFVRTGAKCPAGRLCQFSHFLPDGTLVQRHAPIWRNMAPDVLPTPGVPQTIHEYLHSEQRERFLARNVEVIVLE